MKPSPALLIALLLAPLPVLHAGEFYVSSSGDDAYPGTSNQPFRTIRKASSVMRAGDSCVIREGTYRETIVPPNGNAREPVVYQARPGESVTISGCELVGGWTLHTGRIYKAPWHGTLGAGNQVFVNRRMALQARWPNNPGGSCLHPPLATAEKGSDKTTILCPQLPSVNLSGAGVWIISGTRWEAWTSRITHSVNGSISFSNRASYGSVACRPGANFYVFGSLALLDAENEWVADAGQLFLWAPEGADPATLEVEAKTRYFGIDLSGKKHVEFRGINLFGCSIKTDNGTADIVIDGMTASYVGHWEPFGADLNPPREQWVAMNLKGHSVTLRNSTLFGAAGTLVALSGSNSRIVNCLIHDAGYAGLNSECLAIYGQGHLVSHNTVHSGGRSVIGFDASRSLVAFNDVSRAGMLTHDVGLLTTGNTDGGNSEICFNWFHDNLATGLARGIFFSTGAHNFLVHHNIIWHCWEGGFHGEPPLEYVQLLNNTFYSTPGSFDSGGVDISSFTYVDDQVGGIVVNNVFTDDIRTLGHDVTLLNNLLKDTDPQFAAPDKFDFRLKPTSPGIGKGRGIPGITGSRQPDLGACEGEPWKPGHDFAHPPEPELAFSVSPYWNCILNSSLERGLENWSTTGKVTLQKIIGDPTSNKDDLVHSGRWSARLSGGHCSVQQVTAPLVPNTTYILTGWARLSTADSRAVLGVTDNYGTKSLPFHGDGQALGTWLRRSVAFTTGPEEKPVTVFVHKTAGGSGDDVLIDDIGMLESLTSDPLLTTARADCDQHRGIGLNQFELVGHWKGSSSWTKDDHARVRFNGKQIVLYAQIREDGGIAAISIEDGPESLVDCYYPQLPHHATVQPTVPVFQSQMLAPGPHVLNIRVTGSKNAASRGKTIHLVYADVLDSPSLGTVKEMKCLAPVQAQQASKPSHDAEANAITKAINAPVEKDPRVQSDGKAWGINKATVSDPARPRVLLIGDSILNGYASTVIRRLAGKAYVDYWVTPACQSEGFNKMLAMVLKNGPYDVIHINLGLHGFQRDRVVKGQAKKQPRIPPEQFEPLTKAFVEVMRKENPQGIIIWASTTPISLRDKPAELDPQSNPLIVEHNRMAAKVMAEMQVPVNDLYSLMINRLDLKQNDFHWKDAAKKIQGEAVADYVLKLLPTKRQTTSSHDTPAKP